MQKLSDSLNGLFNMKALQFGIGDLSRATGISQSQLRYWERKGYIHPNQISDSQNRKYSLITLGRVHYIKQFLDDGYTLPVAVKKSNEQKEAMSIIHRITVERFNSMTEYHGRPAVDMGVIEDVPGKRLLAVVEEDGIKLRCVTEQDGNE